MKLPSGSVTAIIPSRGDLDLRDLQYHLLQSPAIAAVWIVVGSTPFNRYLAAAGAPTPWVYTQDDDCLTDVRDLLDNAEPGIIVNAMTEHHARHYPGRQTLIGFGAVFERHLAYPMLTWERDGLFLRESDRVFGSIHEHRTLFPQICIQPSAHHPNRLWKQPEHHATRRAMEQRIFEVTGLNPMEIIKK